MIWNELAKIGANGMVINFQKLQQNIQNYSVVWSARHWQGPFVTAILVLCCVLNVMGNTSHALTIINEFVNIVSMASLIRELISGV